MSHFTQIKLDVQVRHEAEFVAALRKRFKDVEVHELGSALLGFLGDDRTHAQAQDYAPPCNIIIRRKNLWPSANDIGFVRIGPTYTAYVSEFDQPQWAGAKDQVVQEYAAQVAEKKLKAAGYQTNRVTMDNGYVRVTGTDYR